MKSLPEAVVTFGAILVACGVSGRAVANPWKFSAAVSYYDVPNSEDYWNPIVTADRGRLHLEARHNYVTIGTSSLWAGFNFSTGKQWTLDATLMSGVVVGTVEGFGAGYELTLNRSWFQWSSQGEYVLDTQAHQENSLYSWNEFTGSPVGWCRLGVAVQRSNAYSASREIQRGVVAAFSYKKLEIEADILDAGRSDATYILTLTLSF